MGIQMPQLVMHRILDSLPDIQLPPGYSVRSSRGGDDVHWARIIYEAFEEEQFTTQYYQEEMVGHPAYAPDRILFVCAEDGQPCATASAYRKQAFGLDVGYVHFVGVRPSYAGKKLGAAATLAVLHKFVEEGLNEAVLETDDFRLPAITIYRRLGFAPKIQHESHGPRWQAVYEELDLEW